MKGETDEIRGRCEIISTPTSVRCVFIKQLEMCIALCFNVIVHLAFVLQRDEVWFVLSKENLRTKFLWQRSEC